MNKLLIDIGNTAVKIATANSEKLLSVKYVDKLTEADLVSIDVAIVASVRKNNEAEMELLRRYVKKVIQLNHKTPIPIQNLYSTPETLGVDRLAAAVGAHALFPKKDCMIIDCGTAITIDFLNSCGQFIGGNISPGLQTRFKALHCFTDCLPMGTINDNVSPIGTGTQEAIEAGVLTGALNEIEGYIETYPANTVVLTGGDAFYFAKKIKKPIFVVLNLNLMGLAKIVDYNAYI